MSDKKLFSTLYRTEYVEQLSSQNFDLLIIGGGITGAGIALDAASRGIKTALIEKNDFASGTSSRSTKLIHGGLRYLKQLEILLVREVGHERAILHKNAPHIVKPENMLLPIIDDGSLGRYSTSVGLYAYDLLAGVKREERRRMLNKSATVKAEPLLRTDILQGSGMYKEYRTDDARLVIEVLKTANNFGATALNYTELTGFDFENGKAVAAQVKDNITGKQYKIKAKKIVNAGGPWVDEIRKIGGDKLTGKRLHLTKGVHLVVNHDKFPVKQSLYFDVPDGRMIFCIPRGRVTYFGTTDTNYNSEIDEPTTSKADVEYLLGAVNNMFPSINLKFEDIESSWAGLRPLIHEDGKDPSELSRKDEFFHSDSGVISIAGGKLTGYRMMAKRTVDLVVELLEKETDQKYNDCGTGSIILTGGDIKEPLPNLKERLYNEAKQVGYSYHDIAILVDRYGSETAKIIEYAFNLYKAMPDVQERLLAAELEFCISHEMVLTLSDFFISRTGKLYFNRPSIKEELPIITKLMAEYFNWDETEQQRQIELFNRQYADVLIFN